MTDSPRIGVVACMRNEGQFLLEWVAYQRELGFDEVVVLTNDCDDGTDTMLTRLEGMGEARMIPNPLEPGESPQSSGMRRALAHPAVQGCDWILHCDADEFLVIYGSRSVQDLVASMPGHTDCIALHWRAFGNAGMADFPSGGNVLEVCTKAQDAPDPSGFHKSLFRPNKFATAIDHMPKSPWGPVVVRNAAGAEMNPFALTSEHSRYKHTAPDLVNWMVACVHHYAIRADDIFAMKNHRGDGQGLNNTKYFLNSGFYQRFNRNDVEAADLASLLPAVLARKAKYLDDPELARLHQRSIELYQDLKTRVLTPAQRAAWTKPLEQPQPEET